MAGWILIQLYVQMGLFFRQDRWLLFLAVYGAAHQFIQWHHDFFAVPKIMWLKKVRFQEAVYRNPC